MVHMLCIAMKDETGDESDAALGGHGLTTEIGSDVGRLDIDEF
jgi:hypothetical protein